MSTLAESIVSSASRPTRVRMRPDLVATQQRYHGRLYWVVKEPVGLNYFRFEEEEYTLLSLLDGRRSFDEIREAFEERYPPQKISAEELQQFIGSLHRSGLVLADLPGQAVQLHERHSQRQSRERWAAFTNLLALRFKGVDPDRVLDWLAPRTRWLFSPVMLVLASLLGLAALTLVAVQFETFRLKLPSFDSFFAAQNWLLLAVALAFTKVLHEFGHALACKRFGGECHEMGLMLLVMTPCLYVNVSDSWMLPSKWQRAAVGAAGMYVELILASICTFLWWFSEPGLFNYMCLSTMFVCSVSTLVFNANPLMRYDGYYILSDLLEIPNLRQKASTVLTRKLGAWCLGLEEPRDPFLPQRHQSLFALYTIAAAVYRWIVTFSVLWFLYQLFKPYRLEIIGNLIGFAAIYGLVGRPLWKLFKFFHVPGRIYRVKRTRMMMTLAALGSVAALVLFVPLPSRTYCTLEVQPRGATPVYIDVPGRLTEIRVRPGDKVAAGTPLGRLDNLDVHLAVAALAGDRDQCQARVASLEQQRFRDNKASIALNEARESLATLEQQLVQRQADVKRLNLVAPRAGTVLPPPLVAPQELDGELADWSGTPLQKRNLGATLQPSTLFCQIGDPQAFEAVLAVDQADIEQLCEGQTVDIVFEELPHRVYTTKIVEVAQLDLKATSRRLSAKAGGDLATKTDASGIERPLSTTYQALAPVDDPDGLLRIGLCGQAKVHTRWTTLGSRFWRFLSRTFNFEL